MRGHKKEAAAPFEQSRAEDALWENQQHLASIYDSIKDVIFHLAVEPDGKFRFVSVNAAFLRVTGLSREAVIGKAVDEVIPEPSLAMVTEKYRQAIEERRTILWEETSDYPTGRLTGEVSVTALADKTGNCTHLVGSVHDITDRKRAEERLRANEAHLKSAQRLAKLGSWERDDTTGRTDFSDEMLSILGMPERPPQTLMEFLSYVHPEDREDIREGALRARATGTPVAGEFRIVRADGEVRFVRSILEAIRNEHGAVIRVVGATQDITDLKRAQEEALAHQKLESVGTLASGIAHDFNNLLGSVLAQAELALHELSDGLSPERELKAIRKAAIRGAEVVRELMIYAGKDSEIHELVDVSGIVDEMLELLNVSVSKHATLETDLGPNLPAVCTNAAQIRQIVMNLVVNASDALGERDGLIRVTTKYIRESDEGPGLTSDRVGTGEYVQLEVSDTGCGMPAEIRSRVFDPFFSTKSAGHGLGLAVVNGIVRSL